LKLKLKNVHSLSQDNRAEEEHDSSSSLDEDVKDIDFEKELECLNLPQPTESEDKGSPTKTKLNRRLSPKNLSKYISRKSINMDKRASGLSSHKLGAGKEEGPIRSVSMF
jgi:hypothetical protein